MSSISNTKHLGAGSVLPKIPNDGKLVLYSMQFCPYAQRAHLVLDAKKIPYHTVFVDLTTKPEWLPEKSPLTKVPALEVPGKDIPLIESLVITDYLDEKYPEYKLHKTDPFEKAKDRLLVERFQAVSTALYRLLGVFGTFEGAVTDFVAALDLYEEELRTRGTPYFGGAKPGMTDYMIWPWCERSDGLSILLGDKYALDKERFAKLLAWRDLMKTDEAVKGSYISPENHIKFLQSRKEGHPNYDMLLVNHAKKMRIL